MTAHYPDNCWYVAATVEEVTHGEPYACEVAGEAIVMYRDSSGAVVALADRCPHRFAPLSLGRVEGDDLRCMYHGLRFGPDGACIEIPGQDIVPKTFCTATYAVVESFEWIWVWIGDQDLVDESVRPTELGHGSDDVLINKGALEYDAYYELMNDNLCDLSHLAFVHENTLGATSGGSTFADKPPVLDYIDRGIRFDRWHTGIPLAPFIDGGTELTDMWISYDYVLPGVLLMETGIYPDGTAERSQWVRPEGIVPYSASWSTQAVTPLDEHRTRYFFSVSVPICEPHHETSLHFGFMMASMAFEEDRKMIEAQQRVIHRHPTDRMLGIPHDKALNHFRTLVRKAAST